MQTTVSGEIIEPYAEALLSLAQSQQLEERFNQDVGIVLGLLESSDDLQQFLANPLVKAEAKKAVLRQIVVNEVHGYFLNFLLLLVDRRRIAFLEAICQQYRTLLRKIRNTVLAEVITTVELTEQQRQGVIEKVKAMTGANEVELATKLDASLIGGVIVKVGSQVLDASLRGQLRRLSFSLLNAA